MIKSYLSITQVAALRGISPQAVRTACRQGRLRADRIGRAWLIRRADAVIYVDRARCRKQLLPDPVD